MTPDADSQQATLYPSTGVLDSVSLISICLRRPEHVPRAYQIFRQLLEDSKTKTRRMPDTEIWAKVVQAMAELGAPRYKGEEGGGGPRGMEAQRRKAEEEAAKWRDRTRGVVDAWEAAFRLSGQGVVAGREKEGIKVYQGWFAGMLQ